MTNISSLPQHNVSDTTSYYGNMGLNGKEKNDPKKVAGQFELFYQSILKQMREDEDRYPLLGSSKMDQMTEMRDDELSAHLGQMGQLGMADQVLDSIGKTPVEKDYYKEITMENYEGKKSKQQFQQTGLLKDPKEFVKELLNGN